MIPFTHRELSYSLSSSVDWNAGKSMDHRFGAPGSGEQAAVDPFGAGTLARESLVLDGVRLRRECFAGDVMALRLHLENTGDSPVFLRTFTPLAVAGLECAHVSAADWTYVRQPRMKNDMPAAFRIGSTGEEVGDAVRGIPETGGDPGGGKGPLPRRFMSSELSLLTSDTMTLAAGIVPITDALVSAELVVSESRDRIERLAVTCHGDGRLVEPGAAVSSPWVVLVAGDTMQDAVGMYTDLVLASSSARQTRTRPGPTVWCSWYYYGDGFSQAELEENLAFFERTSFPTDVILIDECWDRRWGDWEPNARWPDLHGIAERIRGAGYEPGIWTCCFLAEPRAAIRHRNPHWLLRDGRGNPIRFAMAGMSSYVLDPTHPEVQEHLVALYRRLTREWGFSYHKIDFTRAVGHPDAVFHDRSMNRAQAYRIGLAAIRRGIGEDAYLNICGGFYGPALGFADAQRTGSDVKGEWPLDPMDPALPYGPFTIKQNTLRGWMNRLWHNDPDSLMVRRRREAYRGEPLSLGLLSDAEAETSALNQYLGGGLVSYTENMAEIDEDRLLELSKCSPSIGVAATQVDLRGSRRFGRVFRTEIMGHPAGDWLTVSVINWANGPADIPIDLADLDLPEDWTELLVSEYHAPGYQTYSRADRIDLDGVPPHGCRIIKVQPRRQDAVQLLKTDGHFSMGATEVTSWTLRKSHVSVDIEWPWNRPLCVTVLDAQGRSHDHMLGSGRHRL